MYMYMYMAYRIMCVLLQYLGIMDHQMGLSQGRPRPTSLSPNPLSHPHESHTTPVSPSTSILGCIDEQNAPPDLITQRADRIMDNLQRLPKEEVTVTTATPTCDITPQCVGGEPLPHQEIMYELNGVGMGMYGLYMCI